MEIIAAIIDFIPDEYGVMVSLTCQTFNELWEKPRVITRQTLSTIRDIAIISDILPFMSEQSYDVFIENAVYWCSIAQCVDIISVKQSKINEWMYNSGRVGRYDLIRAIHERGGNACHALTGAAYAGNFRLCNILLSEVEKFNVNKLLGIAAATGNTDLIDVAIKHGADDVNMVMAIGFCEGKLDVCAHAKRLGFRDYNILLQKSSTLKSCDASRFSEEMAVRNAISVIDLIMQNDFTGKEPVEIRYKPNYGEKNVHINQFFNIVLSIGRERNNNTIVEYARSSSSSNSKHR